jgi:hypothetical protein
LDLDWEWDSVWLSVRGLLLLQELELLMLAAKDVLA